MSTSAGITGSPSTSCPRSCPTSSPSEPFQP
uniref:Uncharacterized protein n=1 Tax=Anguilla anguilla TaxID=7936 RepID=A0A0E9SL05_ANGAN